ncbi:TlpA family protein disulfide reductase [Paucihalobacter ruber]|uniref:TlpA family protein disulfide reductase n=1 Tax=Paucihalobacter ruber TaxID=2567861 RepID=A0A506PQE9_9FLAO|nr:TlpA disulfide reductase family protein [Paucihalobacter ruber]TPV35442.1 TlpA family protein disulfide reductase [Paucihalobacter ruber]
MFDLVEDLFKRTLFIGILLLAGFSCNDKKENMAQVAVNAQTEELKIVDFEGLKPYLNKTDDKTYIINFWATWCAPCVKELPYFEEITKQYQGKEVEVILVSLDFPRQFESKLKPFIADKNLQSEVIALNDMDMNSWIPQVDESWSGAIPATLIYRQGKRQFFEKSFSKQELQTLLKQFIN